MMYLIKITVNNNQHVYYWGGGGGDRIYDTSVTIAKNCQIQILLEIRP